MEIIKNSFPQHLSEYLWQGANQHLVAKILCEFSHEKLIKPIAAKEHKKQTVQQFQLFLESNQGLLSYDF
ncbi:hypothetical protein U9990_15950, partial [Lactiplantibacillus plantarum]|uniref:hypothetical protein n=1 Tax=Lactiplantibacillus plantarum TaxID=1590 RepID=UPI003F119B54